MGQEIDPVPIFLCSRSAPVSIPVLNCAPGVPVPLMHQLECTDPVHSEPAGGSTHLVEKARLGVRDGRNEH